MKAMREARAGSPDRQHDKAVDNGGLRYGAMEGALRPPLPTATRPAHHNPALTLFPRRPNPIPA